MTHSIDLTRRRLKKKEKSVYFLLQLPEECIAQKQKDILLISSSLRTISTDLVQMTLIA